MLESLEDLKIYLLLLLIIMHLYKMQIKFNDGRETMKEILGKTS